jgi:hypothetical protein
MARRRLWKFNPGCSPDPCCDEPPETPCCGGLVPTILELDDGLGVVEMTYNGPRPVGFTAGAEMWWGCATRAVTGGRSKRVAPDPDAGSCTAVNINFDTEIVFGLWCNNSANGFRLYIFHDGCGSYDNGINVQTHQIKSIGCETAWGGQYNQIVGGSINGIAAEDCDPFLWGPVSQSFPATPYPHHPLREIYGDSGTWTIYTP